MPLLAGTFLSPGGSVAGSSRRRIAGSILRQVASNERARYLHRPIGDMMTIWTLGTRYLFPRSEVVSMTIHELNGNDELRGT